MNEIFHTGERAIQQKTGEEGIANSSGRLISDSIIGGAVKFIEKQPLAIVGSEGKNGQVWVSLIIGEPGFTKVVQPTTIHFDVDKIRSTREDVFYKNILENPEIGSLFIELSTRRRYRINGRSSKAGSIIKLEVREAYPNCPNYIQLRIITLPKDFEKSRPDIIRGNELTIIERDWISNADTFFVGSRSNSGRLDASHRGGNKGFVKVLNDGTLKIPDYRGNSFYNTLGNIQHNPNVGMLFVDFEKGKTLQLTGKAKLLFDQTSETDFKKTTGTGRYWLFRTEHWTRIANHHKVTSEFLGYSPSNP